jgi:transcriptional regulator with XRE-family HTH domain
MPSRQTAPPKPAAPELGKNLKRLRLNQGWNLSQFAAAAGLPQSTMSKVESGQTSLSYEKLWHVASVLEVDIAELFLQVDDAAEEVAPTARRTIDRSSRDWRRDEHYRFRHLSTELRSRLMMPMLLEVGDNAAIPLPMMNLIGERFAHVLEGPVEFHCQHYEPVRLQKGDSLYVDAAMPHAFVSPKGVRALVLAVLSSSDPEYLKLCREGALRGESDVSSHLQARKAGARSRG